MRKSLLKELKSFRKKEKINMHIPGHKNGRGLSAYFRKNAFDIDVTEVCGTDNLQNPCGIIKNAQENSARVFGAGETYFLTEGSSLGLRAVVLGCVPRGGKLLVDRCCHKSIIAAIALGGVEPVFLTPDFDEELGLYLGVSCSEVKNKLAKHPDVCGAIITSPTYYGICSDISAIADILHKDDKFLIVDEAHGAHFAFGEGILPQTALSLGADACVQSAHKTLPSLGQSSFLHISKDARFDKERLVRTLRNIQTTSPSYMLMASLDEATRYMEKRGRQRLTRLAEKIANFKDVISCRTQMRFIDSETTGRMQDITRLVLDVSSLGIGAREAERIFAEEFSLYAEMADNRYVILVPTVSTTGREIKKLGRIICRLDRKKTKTENNQKNMSLPEIKLSMAPSDAAERQFETVCIEDAVNRISAGVVSVCPPGASVLIPGQIIDENVLRYIIRNEVTDRVDVILP